MSARVSRTVESEDGVPIAYEVRGLGTPALVFVHGWSCDRSYWNGQLETFSEKFKVVTIDLAGHGESGLGRESWTIAAFGGDVAAVVRALELDRVILIGHSTGGDVILKAARQLPGRVDGLVWIDVYKQIGAPRTAGQVESLVNPLRDDFETATRAFVRGMFLPTSDPALVERVVSDMSVAPPAVALPALLAAVTFDRNVAELLRELKLPAVAINPEDPLTDVGSMNRHGVDVVFQPGTGHFPMLEDPAGFDRLLAEVIARLQTGSRRDDKLS